MIYTISYCHNLHHHINGKGYLSTFDRGYTWVQWYGTSYVYLTRKYIISRNGDSWSIFCASEFHIEGGLVLLSGVLFIALFPITGIFFSQWITATNKCKIPEFFMTSSFGYSHSRIKELHSNSLLQVAYAPECLKRYIFKIWN